MFRSVLFTLFLVLLAGCASVTHSDKQAIDVRLLCGERSLPARCVAENSKGRWDFYAPNTVVVSKDIYALRLDCKSVLLDAHTVQAYASIQNAMAGNLLVGGLVGAAIDIKTGRGVAYPASIDMQHPSCKLF